MTSIKMSWSAFICELCAYIFVWALSMSYMEHYILCASMYMCTVLHYVHQAACLRGSHQFQLSSIYELLACWRPGGQRLIAHSMCLQFFCLQDSDQSGMFYSYVGLGPKLHTCILFTIYVYYMIMNATRYYLFSVQVNQYFYSIPVIQFSLSAPVQQVQYFCQYRYFLIQL